jgi:hypothetical protein
MPTTSRAFAKASFAYLIVGSVLGALMLVNRWLFLGPFVASLRVSHIQFLVVGWLTQLILGIAWWLFPPLSLGLRPGEPTPVLRGQAQRGHEPLFWITFASLNTGILLRALFSPLNSLLPTQAFATLSNVADLFLVAAAIAFVTNIWKRVRKRGRSKR